MTRADLPELIVKSLKRLGGTGSVVDVAKEIWREHETDLRSSGDLFYTWQYETRWAAQKLRDEGKLTYIRKDKKPVWQLI